MCVILDTCAFGPFFEKRNAEHHEFAPVAQWVLSGHGKLVIGGSKYSEEMSVAGRYRRLFLNLQRAAKVVTIDKAVVDEHQVAVQAIEDNADFDDPHLVALVRASKCAVVCTRDSRAVRYLKDRRFYEKICRVPKIYQRSKNRSLLTDANIVDVCRPKKKLSKAEAAALEM